MVASGISHYRLHDEEYDDLAENGVEEDEIHLVEPAKIDPRHVLGPAIVFTFFMAAFMIPLYVHRLFESNFELDLFNCVYGVLVVVLTLSNCFMILRIVLKIRRRDMLHGRPEEFRDYVNRVNNDTIQIESAEPRNKLRFWPGRAPAPVNL